MSLFDDASLVLTPNGYKASKLYSIKPTSGAGDMVVSRGTTATRVDSAGLIESVAINVPRLDYPPLGGCPSILVEPLRTNLALRSQELDSALIWFPIAATVTANNATSPDGTVNADKIIATAVSSTHIILQQPAGSVSGTTSSVSIFAKASGLSNIQILNNAGGLGVANFNLSTGTATLSSGVSATIQNYGNGWYRCIVTYTPTTTGNYNIQIRLADSSGNTTFLGNGVDGVSLWGFQIEAGSNATSYIPTVAATATRNADVITKAGISSLIGQTEGTIFWDVKDLVGTTNTGNPDFGIKNSAANHWISLTTSGVSLPFRITVTSAAGQLLTHSANITSAKACVKYGTFGAKLFLNGNPTPVATTAVNPNISFDNILFSGTRISYKTNSFVLWTTALTDAQCISLTT